VLEHSQEVEILVTSKSTVKKENVHQTLKIRPNQTKIHRNIINYVNCHPKKNSKLHSMVAFYPLSLQNNIPFDQRPARWIRTTSWPFVWAAVRVVVSKTTAKSLAPEVDGSADAPTHGRPRGWWRVHRTHLGRPGSAPKNSQVSSKNGDFTETWLPKLFYNFNDCWVYGRYIERVHGVYKPNLKWGDMV
jgi:hypothetical protein